MGRISKPPVKIDASDSGTEVPLQDGLPPFKRFIDIDGKKHGKKILTRLFFVTPSDEEVTETVQMHQSAEVQVFVMGAKMPYMRSTLVSPPIFERCKALGFSEDFSNNIVRLAIRHLSGKHLSKSSVNSAERSLRDFVGFLANHREDPQTLNDISKEIWVDYLALCAADGKANTEILFNTVRLIFHTFKPTSIGGWLDSLKFKRGKRSKPSPEHTSELVETKDYSDVVMYQLLALSIYTFEQRIKYLKHYEDLTEADMPQDWIYPGRITVRAKKRGILCDTHQLLTTWLSDEVTGYQTLIDHYILYHKAGLVRKTSKGDYKRGFSTTLVNFWICSEENRALVTKFLEAMGQRYGYEYKTAATNLLSFYVNNKKVPTDSNRIINEIGWCLANLLMMQTGVNKEVVLTIPSKSENGKSILTRGDTVFITKGGGNSEINLYGIKAKTGGTPEKNVPIIVSKNSPLFEMLVDYERYVKVGDGPFFEFNQTFINEWSTAGGSNDLSKHFPVTDENGEQLLSIDSTRFRKVFASGQLLDRMKNIKDMNELAEKLRDDMNHDNLDTTLTNYLLKSTVGRSIIDIAIATIIGGKLNDLKCRSQVEHLKPIPYKKKVFLCHCIDPHNPSHDVAIADECKHYDLCLGCEQSVITREHLPYICLRILQYEAERVKDPHVWPATFEDRWRIAQDALDRYIATDKKNGQEFVDNAWVVAREGRISLPPIIAST